jgi:hypothetical protein
MAADEPVRGVGKTVLVQCSGQHNPGEHRQDRRRPIPEPEQLGQQKSQCRNPADPGADQRKGPAGIGERLDMTCRCRDRDPSEKGGRSSKAGEYPAGGHAATIARRGRIRGVFLLG